MLKVLAPNGDTVLSREEKLVIERGDGRPPKCLDFPEGVKIFADGDVVCVYAKRPSDWNRGVCQFCSLELKRMIAG